MPVFMAGVTKGVKMPKYLFRASYSREGVNGLLEVGGSSRANALQESVGSVGGTLEAFYYAFGDDDLIMIADLPDDAAATALSLRISAVGAIAVKTTVLLDPTVVDEAITRSVSYTPPGS